MRKARSEGPLSRQMSQIFGHGILNCRMFCRLSWEAASALVCCMSKLMSASLQLLRTSE